MMEIIKNPILCGMIMTIALPILYMLFFEIWERLTD